MSSVRSAPRTSYERGALGAIFVGLGLTVLATVLPYTTHLLADQVRAGYPAYSDARVDSAVTTYLVLLSVIGVLGVLSWLGTAWAVRAGKRWARPAATALFAIGVGIGLTGLLTKDTSGEPGLAPTLGWIGLLPSLAGLVAVALLWASARRDQRMPWS